MLRANSIMTLVGVSALCIASTSVADPCPTNLVCLNEEPCASLTTVSGGREANYIGGVTSAASYNWSTRVCGAYGQLPYDAPPSAGGTVEANEDFLVTGIPPGTPLTIHARFRVQARANAGGTGSNHATGWLEEAGAGHVEATASLEGPGLVVIDQVVALDFPNLAGETFRLTIGARSNARGGSAGGGGTLSFVDLPPGAVISSCQSGGPPVPTTPVSWGSLKSQYR
jgi:hypothetical protein